MLILEGIWLMSLKLQKGSQRMVKNMAANQNSGHVRKQAGKWRNSHGDGDFDCCRYFPTSTRKNSPCARSCGFKRISGKAYLKATNWRKVENGQAQADRLQRASKAPFFGAHNLIHGLKAGCWAWVSRGSRFWKQGKFTWVMGKKKPVFR